MRTTVFVVAFVSLLVPVGGGLWAEDVRTPTYVQDGTAEPFDRLAQTRTSRNENALELAFWNAIQDSNNPAEFQAYLDAFPEGTFAPLARVRARSGGGGAVVEDVDLTYVAVVAANVRARPTAESARVGGLPQGARVQVTGRAVGGTWLRIMHDGRAGFVFGDVLEPLAATPAAAPAAPTPPPAALVSPAAAKLAAAAAPQAQVQVASAAPRAVAAAVRSVEARSSFQDCDTCPEMIVLPGGSFTMGNDRGDKTQRPAREVIIGREFAIGRYEVTVGEWRACLNAGGCGDVPSLGEFAEDSPVRNVSWDDARQYAAWLSQETGRAYRLPSEAEWEYAARSGTQTIYEWGDDLGVDKVACRSCGGEWSRETPGAVGRFEPNSVGLFDMQGSVAEWTDDCWQSTLAGTPTDGSAFDQDECRQRVLRGGSWRSSSPEFLASAARFFYDAPVRYIANGFRVAADQ